MAHAQTHKFGITSFRPWVDVAPSFDGGVDEGSKPVDVRLVSMTIPNKLYNFKGGSITILEDGIARTITVAAGYYTVNDTTTALPPANDLPTVIQTALGTRYQCVLDATNPWRQGHLYFRYLGGLTGNPTITACTFGRKIGLADTQIPLTLPVNFPVYMDNTYNLAPTNYIAMYASFVGGASFENYPIGGTIRSLAIQQEACRAEDLFTYIPIAASAYDGAIVYTPTDDRVSTTLGAMRGFRIELLDDEDDPISLDGVQWSCVLQITHTQ